jgi:hypothetical protein
VVASIFVVFVGHGLAGIKEARILRQHSIRATTPTEPAEGANLLNWLATQPMRDGLSGVKQQHIVLIWKRN